MANMRVWELVAPRDMRLGQRVMPTPGPGEALVRVKHVGVCGSDLHYYEHGRVGGYVVSYPFILGHETGGEVAALGPGVTGLTVGQPVALEPGATCGRCEACTSGRYNLCPDVVFHATPPYDGTLCEYVVHKAELCFPLPAGMGTLEGALVEPLAVGLHAALQGGAQIGQTALVLGGGCIGLCTALSLRAAGVWPVAVSEPLAVRREKAEALGFPTIDPVQGDLQAEGERLCPGGFHMVVETAGAPAATLQSVQMVRRGGAIVLVGLTPDPVQPFNLGALIDKEASVRTVFRYRNLYPAAIRAVSAGLPVARIATDLFSFEEADQAFAYNAQNKQRVVKAVIAL